MELYSLEDLSFNEINALKQSLDFIPITGKDALFIAILQDKLSKQLKQIEEHIIKSQNLDTTPLPPPLQESLPEHKEEKEVKQTSRKRNIK